jgi:hypothetical protein
MGENAGSSTTCQEPASRFLAWTSRMTRCGGCVRRSRARESRICLRHSLSARIARTRWLALVPRPLRRGSAYFSRSSTLGSEMSTAAVSLAHPRRSCLWTSSWSCKGGGRSGQTPYLTNVDRGKHQGRWSRRRIGQGTARVKVVPTRHRRERRDGAGLMLVGSDGRDARAPWSATGTERTDPPPYRILPRSGCARTNSPHGW